MSVILLVGGEVPHSVLAHVDIGVRIRLNHRLQVLWFLVEELLVQHDTGIINHNARSLACIRKELSVGTGSRLRHVKPHNFRLDIWV